MRIHVVNFPAMLRALADVSEKFPYVQPEMDVADMGIDFISRTQSLYIALFATYRCSAEAFRIPFALAYEKHGGNPLLFIDQLQYDHAKAAVNQP